MTLARQELIGLSLAFAILASWIGLHGYTLFFFDWQKALLPSALLIIALTWLSVGLFIIAHDAMHGSIAPLHPKFGEWIGTAALQLYACFSYPILLPKHHAHHKQPGSVEDPDFHPSYPMAYWRWYARFFSTYFGWKEACLMGLRVTIYALLGAPVSNIILFFMLTSIASSLQLFTFGTWLPHRHSDKAFADHHRASSNDYAPWLSLLTCFHFGYHHEHHLRPDVPWWRLPSLRRLRRLGENQAR